MRAPFKIGDLITSDIYLSESDIVRKIVGICKDVNCSSGYMASADGGERCKCGRILGRSISYVDSSWFKKVKERKNVTSK